MAANAKVIGGYNYYEAVNVAANAKVVGGYVMRPLFSRHL